MLVFSNLYALSTFYICSDSHFLQMGKLMFPGTSWWSSSWGLCAATRGHGLNLWLGNQDATCQQHGQKIKTHTHIHQCFQPQKDLLKVTQPGSCQALNSGLMDSKS